MRQRLFAVAIRCEFNCWDFACIRGRKPMGGAWATKCATME
jgi:hypothetical protein